MLIGADFLASNELKTTARFLFKIIIEVDTYGSTWFLNQLKNKNQELMTYSTKSVRTRNRATPEFVNGYLIIVTLWICCQTWYSPGVLKQKIIAGQFPYNVLLGSKWLVATILDGVFQFTRYWVRLSTTNWTSFLFNSNHWLFLCTYTTWV